MIDQVVSFLTPYSIIINFVCCTTIFIGGLYIAIHSRKIPNWLRTCLWYIGCSSFFTAVTILLGWTLGPQFELSYDKIGIIGEILFNCLITITTITFFFKTIKSDIKYSKLRQIM